MFYNISNHPNAKWSPEQRAAAEAIGEEIRDIQFPNVPPTATTAEVAEMADRIAPITEAGVAMVQGESSLAYAITRRLRDRGVRVVVACTERVSSEAQKPDGTIEKTSVFQFVCFRDIE